MPGETKESIRDTYEFVKKSKVDYGGVFYANPLPGTRLFDYAEKHGFIKDRKEIIDENPGKDKGLSDFETYIKHFDFNKLPQNVLIGYKDMIDGMFVVNRDVKTKRYFRALLSYVSIDLLKIPLNFPFLKRHFPILYWCLIHTGSISAEREVIRMVLKKVGLLGFVRRFLA